MRHLAILALILAFALPMCAPAQYVRRRPVTATANSGPYNGPAVAFNGTVKVLTKKEMVVELDRPQAGADQQTMTFRLSKKTKFLKGDQPIKSADIAEGTHISLDAVRDGDLKFSAVNVIIAAAPTPDVNR